MDYFNNIKLFCRIKSQGDDIYDQSDFSIMDNSIVSLKTNDSYLFDHIFQGDDIQDQVVTTICADLIRVDGENCFNKALITYGQSGSCKSYSIQGHPQKSSQNGILTVFLKYYLDQKARGDVNYELTASCYEIYNEKVIDLLSDKDKNLSFYETKDNTFQLKNVTKAKIKTEIDCLKMLKISNHRMHKYNNTGKYTRNRSHIVYDIRIKLEEQEGAKMRQFLFIDLAGYENAFDKTVSPLYNNEAKSINLSLSMLRSLINSISNKESHVSFRNSKLTKLFSGVFKPSCKSFFLVCLPLKNHIGLEMRSNLEFCQGLQKLRNMDNDSFLQKFHQNFPKHTSIGMSSGSERSKSNRTSSVESFSSFGSKLSLNRFIDSNTYQRQQSLRSTKENIETSQILKAYSDKTISNDTDSVYSFSLISNAQETSIYLNDLETPDVDSKEFISDIEKFNDITMDKLSTSLSTETKKGPEFMNVKEANKILNQNFVKKPLPFAKKTDFTRISKSERSFPLKKTNKIPITPIRSSNRILNDSSSLKDEKLIQRDKKSPKSDDIKKSHTLPTNDLALPIRKSIKQFQHDNKRKEKAPETEIKENTKLINENIGKFQAPTLEFAENKPTIKPSNNVIEKQIVEEYYEIDTYISISLMPITDETNRKEEQTRDKPILELVASESAEDQSEKITFEDKKLSLGHGHQNMFDSKLVTIFEESNSNSEAAEKESVSDSSSLNENIDFSNTEIETVGIQKPLENDVVINSDIKTNNKDEFKNNKEIEIAQNEALNSTDSEDKLNISENKSMEELMLFKNEISAPNYHEDPNEQKLIEKACISKKVTASGNLNDFVPENIHEEIRKELDENEIFNDNEKDLNLDASMNITLKLINGSMEEVRVDFHNEKNSNYDMETKEALMNREASEQDKLRSSLDEPNPIDMVPASTEEHKVDDKITKSVKVKNGHENRGFVKPHETKTDLDERLNEFLSLLDDGSNEINFENLSIKMEKVANENIYIHEDIIEATDVKNMDCKTVDCLITDTQNDEPETQDDVVNKEEIKPFGKDLIQTNEEIIEEDEDNLKKNDKITEVRSYESLFDEQDNTINTSEEASVNDNIDEAKVEEKRNSIEDEDEEDTAEASTCILHEEEDKEIHSYSEIDMEICNIEKNINEIQISSEDKEVTKALQKDIHEALSIEEKEKETDINQEVNVENNLIGDREGENKENEDTTLATKEIETCQKVTTGIEKDVGYQYKTEIIFETFEDEKIRGCKENEMQVTDDSIEEIQLSSQNEYNTEDIPLAILSHSENSSNEDEATNPNDKEPFITARNFMLAFNRRMWIQYDSPLLMGAIIDLLFGNENDFKC